MIYVWSDTHFGHAGIIEYCKRPYGSVEEMNESLVNRWNSAVAPGDTIFLLGDFGFGRLPPLQAIFEKLAGHKHLVRGNHDERNPKVLRLPWESVSDLVTLREEGVRAVACHYPLETWKSAHRGYLMLHGHSHGSLKRVIPHRFDVGCDVYYHPQKLSFLATVAETQVYNPQDHHGDDM